MNKSLITYSLIILLVGPIFGFNFLISLIGNIFLLIFLITLLIFLVALLGFNSLKSKVKTCDQCGNISFGTDTCTNCGADLGDISAEKIENLKKPSETIIEVKAEEVN